MDGVIRDKGFVKCKTIHLCSPPHWCNHCSMSQIRASSGHDVKRHHMMPNDILWCPETTQDALRHNMMFWHIRCHTRIRRRWLQLLLLYHGLPWKGPLVNTNRIVKRKDTLYYNTFFNLVIFKTKFSLFVSWPSSLLCHCNVLRSWDTFNYMFSRISLFPAI